MAGTVHASGKTKNTETCCLSSISSYEALRAFREIENCKFTEPALSIEERAVVNHFNSPEMNEVGSSYIFQRRTTVQN